MCGSHGLHVRFMYRCLIEAEECHTLVTVKGTLLLWLPLIIAIPGIDPMAAGARPDLQWVVYSGDVCYRLRASDAGTHPVLSMFEASQPVLTRITQIPSLQVSIPVISALCEV